MKIDDIVVGLKRIRARAEVSGEADFWVTANDAINLLKQISCDDCIRREEAIRIAEQGQIQGFEWQLRKLCTLPSVTPQRPKGHWIPIHPLQEDDDGAYMCSNCEHGDWDCDTSYKYCPFCGAKMRGDEDEND